LTGHGAKLGRKQEDAIASLMTHRTVEEAAKAIGIGHKTLLRWLKLEQFDAEYRRARRDAYGQSIARLQQVSSIAVTAIVKVLADPNTPHSARVRAADCVLKHAAKAIEIEDVEVRVTALEKSLKDDERNGGRN
jgi:hypothetical protein